jgi:hypothetical protein
MRRLLATIALLPRNACVVVLRAYRAVISPLYGNVCRYHPSCSRYALEAIQQFGVVRGSAMGAWRIARCNPWAAGGIDDVPDRRRPYRVNRFGFVLAHPQVRDVPASSSRSSALLPGAQLPRLTNQPARKA